MSIRLMSAVWSSFLPTTTLRFIALALADFANDDGYLYPSVSTIAAKCRLSSRQVQRSLSWLRDHGYLTVGLPEGGRLTPTYRLQLSKLVSPDDIRVIGGVTSTSPRGVTSRASAPVQLALGTVTFNRQQNHNPPTPSTAPADSGRRTTPSLSETKKWTPLPPVIHRLEQELGYKLAYPVREARAVRRALALGYTEEQILACWRMLRQGYWKGRYLPCTVVVDNLGEFVAGRLTLEAQDGSSLTPGERIRRAGYRFEPSAVEEYSIEGLRRR